jgi:hypothetical protein
MIEVPQNADVAQVKRLIFYQAHNQLLPALQVRGRGGGGLAEGEGGGGWGAALEARNTLSAASVPAARGARPLPPCRCSSLRTAARWWRPTTTA